MLYQTHELQKAWLTNASMWASLSAELLQAPGPLEYMGGPVIGSALEVFAHAAAPRGKPAFGFETTTVDGREVAVSEDIVLRLPFGQLKRFVRAGVEGSPKLLIVAPMSGHYATLLRGTVERMLPKHDVYITDWRDAKLVPISQGRFDLDDYIDYVVQFLEHLNADGRRAHVLAVCQPSVPVYAATALMASANNPARPKTLTMMGGPVDTREAPTSVNDLATERPHAWFQNVIATVPGNYEGAGRRVYPGFLQLAGFMSMNLSNHMESHYQMFRHLMAGNDGPADLTKKFYEEYRSVCDMTAEFYLQTIETVFQTHALPKGEMVHRGTRVDPRAIHDTAILAIEGEMDDISGLGQTKAALTISSGLPDIMKRYFMAPEVGHYGIFNGSKWRNTIAPVVEDWIASHHSVEAGQTG